MPIPKVVLFDCYGTLVRWNEGLCETFAAILASKAAQLDVEDFLTTFKDASYRQIQGPYQPYKTILRHSLERALELHGLPYEEEDGELLVAAVPTFDIFPEVPATLEHIRQHCRIALISNTDNDLIPGTVRRIGVPFERVITSEHARAYKPSPVIFLYALQELDCTDADVLHVAGGLWTDIAATQKLGWARVWINRQGEAGDPALMPYHELPDLADLPELLGV